MLQIIWYLDVFGISMAQQEKSGKIVVKNLLALAVTG
jgi:hypothetical protein